MRLKKDITGIKNNLTDAKRQAADIRNILGLGEKTIEDPAFFSIIVKHLKDLNFDLVYTNKIQNITGYGHIPSITVFNEQYNKHAGGRIYIYDKYSRKKKKELFIHEVVHIYDIYTPTWSTNEKDLQNGFIISERILRNVEVKTDLIAMELMMPIDQTQDTLFKNSYNIDVFVDKKNGKYKAINTSTVLMWLTINDYSNAHFAVLYFIDTNNGNNPTEIIKIDEFCNDKSAQDIYDIIYNKNSIAFKTILEKCPNKSGESDINNKKYQCFCYYKEEMQQPLPSSIDPYEIIITCDEMVIIGWSKEAFDFITKLQFKKSA